MKFSRLGGRRELFKESFPSRRASHMAHVADLHQHPRRSGPFLAGSSSAAPLSSPRFLGFAPFATRSASGIRAREGLIPWERLEARIEPFHPKAGRAGGRTRCRRSSGALRAVVLRHERSGDGGHALRDRVGAPVRGAEAARALAGRDDDPELPAHAGAARAGQEAARGDQRALGVGGLPVAGGDDRGCHRRGAFVDEEQGPRAGIRRCAGRRRATSGTSG